MVLSPKVPQCLSSFSLNAMYCKLNFGLKFFSFAKPNFVDKCFRRYDSNWSLKKLCFLKFSTAVQLLLDDLLLKLSSSDKAQIKQYFFATKT